MMKLKKFLKSNRKLADRRLGQSTFEYVLITILLSVLILAGFRTFGGETSFVEKSRDILKTGFFQQAEDRINGQPTSSF